MSSLRKFSDEDLLKYYREAATASAHFCTMLTRFRDDVRTCEGYLKDFEAALPKYEAEIEQRGLKVGSEG